MDGVIWEEFADKRDYLRQVAESIKEGTIDFPDITIDDVLDDDFEVAEGRLLYRIHLVRERNVTIVKKVKENALHSGLGLKCSICDFDFLKTYGDLGKGYIECHHTKPLFEYKNSKKTKLEDLCLVCSNCHRMLHRGKQWVSVDELRRRVSGKTCN